MMSVDSAIARFRRRQEALYRDAANIKRPMGSGTLSTTGVYTPSTATTVGTGVSCLLRAFAWEGTDVQFGGGEVRLRRVRAKFPVDTDLRHNDVVTPTTSTYDESLVGRNFRVTDVFRDGFQIARVAILEEVT